MAVFFVVDRIRQWAIRTIDTRGTTLQQVAVIRRMAENAGYTVEVVVGPAAVEPPAAPKPAGTTTLFAIPPPKGGENKPN